MAYRQSGAATGNTDFAVDPDTLNFIERISWFERQAPIEADNDNTTIHPSRQQQASACFDSWAVPDFMRSRPV